MKNNKKLDMNQQINLDLLQINELLANESADAAFTKYLELIETVESKEYDIEVSLKAEVYKNFAYLLFSAAEYEYFFEMLIKAQRYGYSKDEIESFLREAFIEPNLGEFQNIYETNIQFLLSNQYMNIEKILDFQELPYWLLPTGVENEYYLYDKEEKLIQDKIALYKHQNLQSLPASNAFADYLLITGWNWNSILTCSNAIRKLGKKTYVILNKPEIFLSCLQGALLDESIVSDMLFFDGYTGMNEYFKSSGAFLPRNIIDLTGKNDKGIIVEKIHNDRIRKENRKGNQILLSICIPSFNRGNRAYDTVTHLLQSCYDEEIELIISNNGTQNSTKNYYDQIRDLDDSRVKYFAFEENQGFAINCCKVCEMAEGDFILLLSDEDLLNMDVLDQIMSNLHKAKETLALMKTSSASQYKLSNLTATPGKDALLQFMLTSNYISGLILNNNLLKQNKGIEYIKENIKNSTCFYYPHMYWELLLSQYGNVQSTNLALVVEGKAEKTEVEEVEIGGGEISIPYYASIEGRLEQHEGFSKIFKDMEICQTDTDVFRQMYIRLCGKTLFLTRLSIDTFYKKTNSDTQELLDRVYKSISSEEFYIKMVNNNQDNYRHDLEIIKHYYIQSKNRL
ncbi:glycosyltransferase [Paenibacillus zanthoxyli]|uniref:glycosyltransferase n=1 Tax=Paenibacillus zanthoxyli TaxID=369399 RepID=UPI0004727057|nr:glycosyltransferase [Paenibacillus zanthoxyli]